ncbi:hypothetical protein NECAME_00783 [Necator americanus]|uniref:EF-hand domain-containing protein n=1 Tax=Necator americanus TaxID=51031 RepID=W2SVB9_NECAM|nr:hypothetical protein NECAME_00783 [Necator americanus]ETN73694.1 hypothetical protein NECAME_00783 [Necator americanus]
MAWTDVLPRKCLRYALEDADMRRRSKYENRTYSGGLHLVLVGNVRAAFHLLECAFDRTEDYGGGDGARVKQRNRVVSDASRTRPRRMPSNSPYIVSEVDLDSVIFGMFHALVILTRIAILSAVPVFVDHGDIPEVETSYPVVNLDLLRYLSDTLRSFFEPEERRTTPDPRGMDFAQFVATNRCSGQAAWNCFNEIDTNSKRGYFYEIFKKENEADNDDDGYVAYKEGVDYAENVLKVRTDDNWRQLFQAKDFDGDGQLNKKEFMSLVSSWYRGDYNLKFNDYTLTSPKTPRPNVTNA